MNPPEFSIDSILPGVIDPANQEDLKSVQGSLMKIDTTYVRQNYLLEDDDDSAFTEEAEEQDFINTSGKNNLYKDDDEIINVEVNDKNIT